MTTEKPPSKACDKWYECDHDECHETRHRKARESARGHAFRASGLVPGWCRVCGVRSDLHVQAAPSEDLTVMPGDEGYENAFDVCPEPTCSLYGKAVMADHGHLTAKARP